MLLTEAIFCNGGNTELVKILNRVGAVACADTCNRLATQVIKQRIKEGIKGSVNQGVFSIASVDNIDILQPFATVSALDATRSLAWNFNAAFSSDGHTDRGRGYKTTYSLFRICPP